MLTQQMVARSHVRDRLGDDREVEDAAGTERALDPDLPPHQLDEALADRQAESRAAVAPGRRGIDLAEGPEEAVPPVSRDADPGVANGEMEGLLDAGPVAARRAVHG